MPNPKLTIKEVKLIKALVSGKSLGQAGMIATGSSTPQSGATQAGRMLKRDDVKIALELAFEKHDITIDKAVAPIGKALIAKKQIWHGADSNEAWVEEVEDIELQLKGSDRALKLMGIGQATQVEGGIHFHNHVEEKKSDYEF